MNIKKTITLGDALKNEENIVFSTMVKPAGSACNLNCTYCYYLDKAVQYENKQPIMSEELLEEYIRQYISAVDADEANFIWHGGEPLILGLKFYEKALAFQKKYSNGKKINNSIQTNGILVNDDWCRFFCDNNFLVGISIDGPKDIHDTFRLTKNGAPTFDRVIKAIETMHKRGVQYNTLSVVNSLCENRGAEIYNFFKSIGSRYMQFLPAVEHVVQKENFSRPLIVSPDFKGAQVSKWSVSAKGYGKFLISIFDKWIEQDVGEYFVQIFDSTLAQWCNITPGLCVMCETCGDNLVVEHNGDVFSCDHFVYPQYKLGNIKKENIRDIYKSKKRFAFGINKRNKLPAECLRCKYYFACRGGCPKHCFENARKSEEKINSLCQGYKMFFEHSAPYMEYMRNLLSEEKPPSLVMQWIWANRLYRKM